MSRNIKPFRKPRPDAIAEPPPTADVREPCEVFYGHNEPSKTVLMAFNKPITQLFLTPEQAEDVARQLQYRAAAARGKKPA